MSADAQIRNVLIQMEDSVYAVERYARVLNHMSGSPHMIEAECLDAISSPLLTIGIKLREQYKAAFAAAGGQAS